MRAAYVLIAAAVAVALTGTLAGLIAWAGPVDPPGARTSHKRATPTSGGLAIMAGSALGALVFAWRFPDEDVRPIAATVGLGALLGLFGALDDVLDLGAKTKLAIQAAAALAFAIGVDRIEVLPVGFGLELPLGPVLGALGTSLWIVVATNAVNFMDGADGVAPGGQAIALAALALAAFEARLDAIGAAALAGAAACAGFLPWNLRGRLFQGDVGALFSSYLFAGLAVLAARGGGGSGPGAVFLYFGPLALLPFLTDVLLTLLLRARRGERLFEAHRDHLYQLWLRRAPARPHRVLAARTATIMAAFAAVALLLQQSLADWRPMLFALAVVCTAIAWRLARRPLEREHR